MNGIGLDPVFWLIIKIGRKDADQKVCAPLDELQIRLGKVPSGPVFKDEEAPMIDEINRIAERISFLTIKD